MTRTMGFKIRLDLRILVYEDQGVGDVSVAEMNNGTPHPGSELALTRRQDAVHRFAHSRTLLYAIQALTGVGQRAILCQSKSLSARYQSLNMSFNTSRQSIMDCAQYVN